MDITGRFSRQLGAIFATVQTSRRQRIPTCHGNDEPDDRSGCQATVHGGDGIVSSPLNFFVFCTFFNIFLTFVKWTYLDQFENFFLALLEFPGELENRVYKLIGTSP